MIFPTNERPWLSYVLLIVLLSVGAFYGLLRPGYFSMHDDVQVMRLYQMEKCFTDGQIPCRWVPDMGAEYGHPLYNFHPVLPYYFGTLVRILGISFIDISKLLFFVPLVCSGIFMYFLAKEFFGKVAGLVSAVFYIYAPYRALDIYVRGALTENWGIMFFPLILFSFFKYIKESRLKYFILSILSVVGLLLSHNIMSLLFLPIALMWVLLWAITLKKKDKLVKSAFSFLWALGLSAFFVMPAFFERDLVRIDFLTSDYYNFTNHFVSLKQLFLRTEWGFGGSVPGFNDSMSFQVGLVHWLAIVATGLLLLFRFFVRKESKQINFLPIFLLVTTATSIYMTHSKSFFLWKLIPILSFVQFPWRFLAIAVFAGSFFVASFIGYFKGFQRILFGISAIFLVILINFSYFRPQYHYTAASDLQYLSGEIWESQSRATLLDYVPKEVDVLPESLAPHSPWTLSGDADISQYRKRSNFWRFTIEVNGGRSAQVAVPIFDFPYWETVIEGVPVVHEVDSKSGIILLSVPPGKHTVTGWLRDTSIRKLGNFLTVFSFAALIIFLVYKDRRHERFI